MNDTGYVYVPTSCQSGEKCKVHVAFHGCQMTLDDIVITFYTIIIIMINNNIFTFDRVLNL